MSYEQLENLVRQQADSQDQKQANSEYFYDNEIQAQKAGKCNGM